MTIQNREHCLRSKSRNGNKKAGALTVHPISSKCFSISVVYFHHNDTTKSWKLVQKCSWKKYCFVWSHWKTSKTQMLAKVQSINWAFVQTLLRANVYASCTDQLDKRLWPNISKEISKLHQTQASSWMLWTWCNCILLAEEKSTFHIHRA